MPAEKKKRNSDIKITTYPTILHISILTSILHILDSSKKMIHTPPKIANQLKLMVLIVRKIPLDWGILESI